jgi:hypothetical protein
MNLGKGDEQLPTAGDFVFISIALLQTTIADQLSDVCNPFTTLNFERKTLNFNFAVNYKTT